MPPAEFAYLVKKDRADNPAESVEDRYKSGDLLRRLVVRDEGRRLYLVFDSREEYLGWLAKTPETERCFHEVVFGHHPQRLKFDVDARAGALAPLVGELVRPPPESELDDLLEELLGPEPPSAPSTPGTAEAARALMELLLEAILDELYIGYYGTEGLNPSRKDLVVTDSSGWASGEWKYSYHVLVLPYVVADNREAQEFSARVFERLPEVVRGLVDPDVNKRTQNFRLAGSTKPGSGRYKLATREASEQFGTAGDVPLSDLFVTAEPGARVLARVYTEEKAAAKGRQAEKSPQGEVVQAVLEFAAGLGILEGHHFTEARGELLCFDRAAPSHCRICGETHHRDNSLMLSLVSVRDGSGAWRVFEHCRQARGRRLKVGVVGADGAAEEEPDDVGDGPDGGAAPRAGGGGPRARGGGHSRVDARLAELLAGADPHEESEFERLPEAQRAVYSAGEMRPYELVGTLAVRAQMKLGKTKALRAYLDRYFPADGLESAVIRFVTFRQTFSRSLSKAFADFVLYSDVTGDLDQTRHPRLIVQAESLYREKMPARPAPIDLLVLDEVESVLAQFSSGLHRHFNAAFAMFQWYLRTARHVVAMDANLGDRTFAVLARMRPAHPPLFHWNCFDRAADDRYYFTQDQGAWLGRLYSALRGGQRIVVPTNSLAEGRAIEEGVRREFPRLKVAIYSSETLPSEKTRHFGDVHTFWGDLDVLIYTPTCTAGVSFELRWYDALFGFFCDVSCDVETCRQMLCRVRDIGSREHYICFRATGAALPATTAAIRKQVYNKRASLYRNVEDAALDFEYSPGGEILYHESDFFTLWLETVRVDNLSRNEFVRRFIDQVADTGAAVAGFGEAPEAPGAPAAEALAAGAALLAAHRAIRGDLQDARHGAVAAAADLAPEEAAQVREALQGQKDVAPDRRLSYEKYLLCEAYSWHGRPVSAAFVKNYQSFAARRVYRNLGAIVAGATPLESIRMLQAKEAASYSWTMATRSPTQPHLAEGRDLLRDKTAYVFQSHFVANWLMAACGFTFADKRRVHAGLLEARLRSVVPRLCGAAELLVYEFEIPKPAFDRLGREPDSAKFLSGVLRSINGVLRSMYGYAIARVSRKAAPQGGAYSLGLSPVGKLFVFSPTPEPDDAPGGPRPHIRSNLVEVPPDDDEDLELFLLDAYYGSPEAASEPEPEPDGAGEAPSARAPPAPPTDSAESARAAQLRLDLTALDEVYQ